MYACLYQLDDAPPVATPLSEFARSFSPAVEQTDERTVIFSIAGLGRLFGSPDQLASEIGRRGAELGLAANLAIAGSPDIASLAARHLPGVTIVPVGREASVLGRIRLAQLPLEPELADKLRRWGLGNLEDVASLPPIGLAERLGEDGVRLYNLANGRTERPLRLEPPPIDYREQLEFDDPVTNLEPLLFLLSRLLNDLCQKLETHDQATNRIALTLGLASGTRHERVLELPVAQKDTQTLLKLLRLDLEAHPPAAAVVSLVIEFQPVRPKSLQHGLFTPPSPAPDKLQLTLARVAALAGEGNVGSPVLLDTHRPDAFALQPFAPPPASTLPPQRDRQARLLRQAMRLFRPPLEARVRVRDGVPRRVAASGVTGAVEEHAGPWRTSGGWWTEAPWARDEWDLALTDGGVYRVYCTLTARQWFVHGVYD